jgi:hypothetical protein
LAFLPRPKTIGFVSLVVINSRRATVGRAVSHAAPAEPGSARG